MYGLSVGILARFLPVVPLGFPDFFSPFVCQHHLFLSVVGWPFRCLILGLALDSWVFMVVSSGVHHIFDMVDGLDHRTCWSIAFLMLRMSEVAAWKVSQRFPMFPEGGVVCLCGVRRTLSVSVFVVLEM